MRGLSVFAAVCTIAFSASAFAKATDFEDTIPAHVLNDHEDRFFSLTIENDFFGSGTDQQYTNGVRGTWYDTGHESPMAAQWIASLVPTFEVNETTSTYYSVGHNLYTPRNTSLRQPDPNDRPYAAFLYGSAGMTSITDDHLDDMEITLGVVGPMALGEEIQSGFHDLINSYDPKGWDAQLENEPGLMLSWQRSWPEFYAGRWGDSLYTRLTPHLGTTVGNIYTYANTGFTVQLMPHADRWQSEPLHVRPTISGSGFFARPKNTWSWMLFAGLDGRAVARDIFLDGNSFRDSPSVDKKHFVADANAGIAFTYGATRISYTLNWRSKEFHGQDKSHIFGAISLGYRF